MRFFADRLRGEVSNGDIVALNVACSSEMGSYERECGKDWVVNTRTLAIPFIRVLHACPMHQ